MMRLKNPNICKKLVAEPGQICQEQNLDMQRFLLHGPKAEAHGRAEQLNQAWFNSDQVL